MSNIVKMFCEYIISLFYLMFHCILVVCSTWLSNIGGY